MAAITSAVVVGAAAAYSANRKGAAEKKAANAKRDAAESTLATNQGIYDQSVANAQPWLTTGQNASNIQNQLLNGDYSSFKNSPDYQFALDQGLQGLDRSAAARGSLYSGGTQADTLKFAEGLATQNYQNYLGQVNNLSSMGQNQSQYLGQLGSNFADQQARAMGQKGDARAQYAAAGPMEQAGYGNALASAVSAYAGGGGGFGGSSGGFNMGSLGGFTGGGGGSAYNPGSLYNFGNNLGNFGGRG